MAITKETMKTYLILSGKHKHPIAGMGPCVVTKVTLKTSSKVVSYDMSTTRNPEEGGFRGVGAVFCGRPVHLFSTVNNIVLEQNEQLTIELQKDSDALCVEVETEGDGK